MLKIGLTGGIGSGKTTVANYFQQLGVTIIDSDKIARDLTNKFEPAYFAIFERFGNEILTLEKEINREALRELIFANPEQKQWLEDLLHPLIKQKISEQIANSSHTPYCIIIIPLLVETQTYNLIDRILLVDASIENQIIRTGKRDDTNPTAVINILKQQASREERLAVADDIIYNNGDLEELRVQVNHQHDFYLRLIKETNT